jgi:hypothetical protein
MVKIYHGYSEVSINAMQEYCFPRKWKRMVKFMASKFCSANFQEQGRKGSVRSGQAMEWYRRRDSKDRHFISKSRSPEK